MDTLRIQDYSNFEIVLVDNASQDDTAEIAARYNGRVRFLRLPVNSRFSECTNAGAAIATGEILMFLNPDTVAQPGWLHWSSPPDMVDVSWHS